MSAAAPSGARLGRPVVAGLALSLLAMGTSTFGTLGLGALAPYLRETFRLSTFEVGALPALVFLGAVLASVPAGRLADRLGAGGALSIGLVGVAAGIAVAATAPVTAVFLGGVWIGGIGYGAINPATNVLSTSLIPRRRRAFFLSIKQAGVTLGGLASGALLPRLADALGWRDALLVPIAALLACLVAARWTARRERVGWFDQPAAVQAADARETVALPGARSAAAFGFVNSGVQLSLAGYLTVYLVETQHVSKPLAGLGLSLAFGAGALGRVVWGALSDRRLHSHSLTLLVTSAGSVLALCGLAAGPTGALLWTVVAVAGFCSIGWNGVFMALLTDRAGMGDLGRATGRGLIAIYGGVVLVPPLLGILHDATHSWPAVWAAGAVAVGLAAVQLALSPRDRIEVPTGEPSLSGTAAAAGASR